MLPDKVGCVFLMVVFSISPHAEIGLNDHREGPRAPHFIRIKNETLHKNPKKLLNQEISCFNPTTLKTVIRDDDFGINSLPTQKGKIRSLSLFTNIVD